MTVALLITLLTSAAAVLIYYSLLRPERTGNKNIDVSLSVVFLSALLLRIGCALAYPGHATDMSCFSAWSEMIFKDGFSAFYTSESFTDYPPGYMYILYVIGFLKKITGADGGLFLLLLRLPAILCDLISAAVIYRVAKKHSSKPYALICAALLLFNPAVIINSAVWGQTDAVYTLFVLLMLYCLTEKRLIPSYFLFAAAVFIKPQALFFAPALIFGIIEQVFLTDFSARRFVKNLLWGLSAICAMVLLSLPFGLGEVVKQYTGTLASYSYASVNAYNIWTLLGLNWHSLTPFMSAIGYTAIILTVAAAAVIFFKGRAENRYYFTAAFICFSTFMLSVKMHDRYAFAAIPLLLLSFVTSKKGRELLLFVGISATQLLNAAHVLFYYDAQTYYTSGYEITAILISAAAAAVLVCLWIYAKKTYIPAPKPAKPGESRRNCKITRRDVAVMSAITLIYSAAALYNLGDVKAPQSNVLLEANKPVVIDLGENTQLSKIRLYTGSREISDTRTLDITLSREDGSTSFYKQLDSGAVFCWLEENAEADGRYLELTSGDSLYITEIALYNADGELITPGSAPGALFDEQALVPGQISFRNSTYFDEIYHARTAYEFIHGQEVYEWTHPPLGKIFISLGIRGFGMTPFGWRIAGTLFGILMLPAIYIFAKKMLGRTWLATFCTVLFAADFMHFAQTRIATIDVYVTFFILLMYLFMYSYCSASFYDTPLKKSFIPLFLSGLSMGLAIACKWTGMYAGAGLAVIFFVKLYRCFCEKRVEFKERAVKTVIFCSFAFVAVPAVIYAASYIPFVRANGCGFEGIIQNQTDMLTYHGKTVVESAHPFSSPWYQWPIVWRPIWYYSGENGALSENISSMGNPLVWWAGIAAFMLCAYDAVKYRDRNAQFLTAGYLAQLLPWVFVTRTTFIYHYFPAVPFVILMLGYSADRLYRRNKSFKKYALVFAALCVLAFIAFYTAISGYPAPGGYIRNFLRWLPSWQLIG